LYSSLLREKAMLEKENRKLQTSLKLLEYDLRKERNLDMLNYLSEEIRSIVFEPT